MKSPNEIEKSNPLLLAAWALRRGILIDDPERNVDLEWLGEPFICNVDVINGRGSSPSDDVGLTELLADGLADAMVELLNVYDPPPEGMEWHKHSDPVWWAINSDGEKYETDNEQDVETVQYQIYMVEK